MIKRISIIFVFACMFGYMQAKLLNIFDECSYSMRVSGKSLKNSLKVYTIACQMIKDALASYLLRTLEDFDANAGDKACHVATAHVLSINTLDQAIAEKIGHICSFSIRKLQKQIEIKSKDVKEMEFGDFIARCSLQKIDVPEDLEFLAMSKFVTAYYSKEKYIQRSKEKVLALEYGISTKKARMLIQEVRQKLNMINNNFIVSLASLHSDGDSAISKGLRIIHPEGKVQTHSAYLAFKTVYNYLSSSMIPVVINIAVVFEGDDGTLIKQYMPILYRAVNPGDRLVPISYSELKSDSLCYVSDALLDLSHRLIQVSLSDAKAKMHRLAVEKKYQERVHKAVQSVKDTLDFKILWLSQAATHPQYVGNFKLDFSKISKQGCLLASEFNHYYENDINRRASGEPVLYLLHDYPSTAGHFYAF